MLNVEKLKEKYVSEKVICDRCKGTGREYSVFLQEEQDCHICNGKGYIWKE